MWEPWVIGIVSTLLVLAILMAIILTFGSNLGSVTAMMPLIVPMYDKKRCKE